MERKKKYTAPAVLEEFHLETEVRILWSSVDVDPKEDFEPVETMGQDVDNSMTFNHTWE